LPTTDRRMALKLMENHLKLTRIQFGKFFTLISDRGRSLLSWIHTVALQYQLKYFLRMAVLLQTATSFTGLHPSRLMSCFTQRKPSSKFPQSFNKIINGQLNAVHLETSFMQL